MKLHFIAIGGKAMHNLALTLGQKGYQITGSDDEIYDPSRNRLKIAGLLPEKMGWFPERIHQGLDAVILGMHARKDNPELLKAINLGLKVYSYPEYLYAESKTKKRIVVCGSHGKTTTTAMIMQALHSAGVDHDYMVGAQLEGYERMVRLTDAEIIVLEGDEYLSSPIDMEPKFLHYHPHIAVITGIAWDHINVFPTFEIYLEQFRKLCRSVLPGGSIVYFENDENVVKVIKDTHRQDIEYIPYGSISLDEENRAFLAGEWLNLPLIGIHNYQNMKAAMICAQMVGVTESQFARAMILYKGASRRLQRIQADYPAMVFLDYAHAPSKVAATTEAVKKWYKDKKLIAIFELHTFSSLNRSFLPQYKGALDKADMAMVYFDDHTIEMKKMDPLDDQLVRDGFGRKDCRVYNNKESLVSAIKDMDKNAIFLFMSSGTFSGIDLNNIFRVSDI